MWPGSLRVSEVQGRNTCYKGGFFSEDSLLSRSPMSFYLQYKHIYKYILPVKKYFSFSSQSTLRVKKISKERREIYNNKKKETKQKKPECHTVDTLLAVFPSLENLTRKHLLHIKPGYTCIGRFSRDPTLFPD